MITFVMPLATDSRINRRVQAVLQLGERPTIFTFERPSYGGALPERDRLDVRRLGYVEHGRYLRRIPALVGALARLWRDRRTLERSRVIYVFGADCLAITVLVLRAAGIRRPRVFYEVADVRETLSGPTLTGRLLRWLERWLLGHVEHVVVTSEKYRDAYYVAVQGRRAETITVIENKLFPPVPDPLPRANWDGAQPLRIGNFGLLRFQEGWDALMGVADRLAGRVSVYVRGYQMTLRGFDRDIERPNVEYAGTYVSPGDLAGMYAQVDVLWVVYDARQHRNLAWAMANRFYEAAYYGVPIIAVGGSYVAERVARTGIGWVIPDATAAAAAALIERLTPAEVARVRGHIRSLPTEFSIGERDLLEFFGELTARPHSPELAHAS